ncbi:MAG TPA: lipoyl synthase [Kiritimatiellia bacterium]|nr:lipoyl synthase [Kiritimatiellia bacterium]HNR93720.1 lipoyl synthase [Kiritimatiellia bacterium]HNS81735.1 lipoyl synthase [Kiritimatiellia bacterium]HPA78308.1 lipoyl synthase [Kiritimatiellia bacterium]HQQ04732.1 lipoyl synthase [Kiritimatiellia bacterium]
MQQCPPKRLPAWMRTSRRTDRSFVRVQRLLEAESLCTVCQDAKCPNRLQCWNEGTATFMILGHACTRNCRFCAVQKTVPREPDPNEPASVARAVKAMNLRHAVITSVTRDDLPDGGAGHFAGTVRMIRAAGVTVEVLVPDFNGCAAALETVLDARPDVFGHNIETVRRLQAVVRPMASYERSLAVLRAAAAHGGALVKSGLMLGMGETRAEILQAMDDLLEAGCELLTMGQYLAPTPDHYPAASYLAPEEFDELGDAARAKGFRAVASGPLVRSSYRAAQMFVQAQGAKP